MPTNAEPGTGSWWRYRVLGAALHQPLVLRIAASLARRWPIIEDNVSVAVRSSTAAQVFRRTASFSHTAHAPNLVAGPFVIGWEEGPRHRQERAFAASRLPSPQHCGQEALDQALSIANGIAAGEPVRFDLIDDYMARVAWAGMRGIFGQAADALEQSPPLAGGTQGGQDNRKAFFGEMRYPGAHLLVGSIAPRRVQRRAQAAAAGLNNRVQVNLDAIRQAWATGESTDLVHRTAVGLMWVGHPATTQSGALIMQELIGRPRIYQALWEKAQALGKGAATDTALRDAVREHVIEALRFRPPFPVLNRDVPRETEYELPNGRRRTTKAGCPMSMLGIGAMFDRRSVNRPEAFDPQRPLAERGEQGERYMIFGHGPRGCIAAEHVVEILTSALIGLLILPRLTWAHRWWRRIRYDGPIITRMRLRAAT